MIQQNVSIQEIQEAGGLVKFLARETRNPSPPPTVSKKATVPQARGRRPKDRRVGYDAERMNKLEAKYAGHLEAQRLAGKIVFWRYESVKFRLADRTWYSPDFYVMLPDGTIEIHETKGWMEDDANVKIKATAELFPEFWFVLVKWEGGGWRFKRYREGKCLA